MQLSGYFDKSECQGWIDLQEQALKMKIASAALPATHPLRFRQPNPQTFCRSPAQKFSLSVENQEILPILRILPGSD